MKTTKKALLLTVCALVLVVATVMGTMAYLTDKDDVKNTFAAAKLLDGDFVLTEHKLERDDLTGKQTLSDTETTDANAYKIVPGAVLPKDPWVEFNLAESAYLFLVVEDKLPEGMHWNPTDNWMPLMNGKVPNEQVKLGENPVYVYGTSALNIGKHNYKIIEGDKITVDGTINLEPVEGQDAVTGNLNFYGYLVQAESFDNPLAAWNAYQASLKP